jgi:prepilin-type processing-associated H-X9-DG protein
VRILKPILWILVVLVLLLFLGLSWPVELVLYLLLGWALFLVRVGQQIEYDWPTIALSIGLTAVFAFGLHRLLAWLYSSYRDGNDVVTLAQRTSASGNGASWSTRWTAAVVTMVLMLFVAGTSTVGITHQIFWLATSPGPLFQSGTREAALRNQSLNQLKQLAIGAQDYQKAGQVLPPGAVFDSRRRALHGWQALLLPFIEQSALYDRIDFSRPWTDDTNAGAFQIHVSVYQTALAQRHDLPQADDKGYSLSDYASNTRVIGPGPALPLSEITDGPSKTIVFGEALENRKPWGYPANWRDPALGLNRSADGFGAPWSSRVVNFAFADGHCESISEDINPKVLRALATPAGGDSISNP